jgi:manganese/zinc/iron transport system permease protein
MVVLSATFGALSGIVGATISSLTARLPTGPTIVLCISGIVLLSLSLAPNRGLVYNWWRQRRRRHRLRLEAVLLDLFELAAQHDNHRHPHQLATLESMSHHPAGTAASLRELQGRGWSREVRNGVWQLTADGEIEAERLLQAMGKQA